LWNDITFIRYVDFVSRYILSGIYLRRLNLTAYGKLL